MAEGARDSPLGRRRTRASGALFAVAVAVLVASVWRAGLDPDEPVQLLALLHQPRLEDSSAPFDLYDFGQIGDDATDGLRRALDLHYDGAVKWCLVPTPVRIAFVRPLSSAFLSLEFWAFGFHFRLYHLVQVALVLGAAAMFVRLWSGEIAGAGLAPLPGAALTALLVLNPLMQELVTRICTVHYALAALFGFATYLALLDVEASQARRALSVAALAGASFLASEAAVPVHILGSAAILDRLGTLDRRGRALLRLVWGGVLAYLFWYVVGSHGATGLGYAGSSNLTGPSTMAAARRGADGALDLVAGAFLTLVPRWQGFLELEGTHAGLGALGAACAFVGAIGLFAARVPRARRLVFAIVVAASAAGVPVAALGQTKLRTLALPGLALQLLLVLVVRETWLEWRRARAERSGARWPVVVLLYAAARLGATVGLAPLADRLVVELSEVYAARWLDGLDARPRDVAPVTAPEGRGAPEGDVNVLIASGTTGVPYPFGPWLLARAGLDPDVSRWLFLSDLPPNNLLVWRLGERTYRVGPTSEAALYSRTHHALYPLAQRCLAVQGSTIETRFATIEVFSATRDGDPYGIDVTFRPSVHPHFFSRRGDRLVPVEMPAVGSLGRY